MTVNEIIIQAIGWGAMLVYLASYQTKSNKMLYIFQMIGSGLFCLQFCLMGAFSGCLSLILLIAKSVLLLWYNKKPWVRMKIWPALFSAGLFAAMIVTWKGPVSLLPFAAATAAVIFYWTNNAGLIRLANLCVCSPCWIVYDIIQGSMGGVASEAITMISIIISVVRFGWASLIDKNSQFQK